MSPWLLVAWLTVCGGDAVTTNQAMAQGGRELLLPTQSRPMLVGSIAVQAAAGAVIYRVLRPQHPTLARVLAGVSIGSHGVGVVWNVRQLH